MKEILKLSRKKGQKTLPMNKTHNTLEKMRSWEGGGGWGGTVATKTDKVVFLSFFFFNKKSSKNKKTKQNEKVLKKSEAGYGNKQSNAYMIVSTLNWQVIYLYWFLIRLWVFRVCSSFVTLVDN